MNARPTSPLATLRRSRGVGLVTAVFLLVVISMLAIAIVGMSTAQQNSSALDMQGARAYQAARAGLEWGMYRRLRNSMACTTAGTATTFSMPAGTMADFSVTVVCTRIDGPTSALSRYRIVSTACTNNGGACPKTGITGDYLQRTMEVQL